MTHKHAPISGQQPPDGGQATQVIQHLAESLDKKKQRIAELEEKLELTNKSRILKGQTIANMQDEIAGLRSKLNYKEANLQAKNEVIARLTRENATLKENATKATEEIIDYLSVLYSMYDGDPSIQIIVRAIGKKITNGSHDPTRLPNNSSTTIP